MQKKNARSKLTAEEHAILREIRKHGLDKRPLFLAVSGGLDSFLLMNIIHRLQPILKSGMAVGTVHHGDGTRIQKKYRTDAVQKVKAWCRKNQVSFFTNEIPSVHIRGEKALREFRYQQLQLWKSEWCMEGNAVLVLAHHQNDLLETQFLRLIRGTGPEGFQAFSFYNNDLMRPLILFTRNELKSLAKKWKLKWLEDPSNRSDDPLRNWLRHQLIPRIEKRCPGSQKSMARTFSLVAANNESKALLSFKDQKPVFSRQEYLDLRRADRAKAIVQFIKHIHIWTYQKSQVDEIVRQLDNRRERFKFALLKHEWCVSKKQIWARKIHL